MKNEKINLFEAVDAIMNTNGKIFSAVFVKKDGTERAINCRLGVKKDLKGTGLKFDPYDKGLVPVYDMQKRAYRMLNTDTLRSFTFNGVTKEVY